MRRVDVVMTQSMGSWQRLTNNVCGWLTNRTELSKRQPIWGVVERQRWWLLEKAFNINVTLQFLEYLLVVSLVDCAAELRLGYLNILTFSHNVLFGMLLVNQLELFSIFTLHKSSQAIKIKRTGSNKDWSRSSSGLFVLCRIISCVFSDRFTYDL